MNPVGINAMSCILSVPCVTLRDNPQAPSGTIDAMATLPAGTRVKDHPSYPQVVFSPRVKRILFLYLTKPRLF
jgi:hypothetical protein